MPINLVTGQPRNGKTLWTLWHVRRRAEQEGRTVFYNIGDDKGGKPKLVKIPGWVHLERPEDWPTCPDNSIVVIDEAQRPFRPRASSAKVPEHVSLLETHGHNGFDLYFITQHPGLIEGNVLRLVQTHRHVKRLWGSQAATVHEWEDVNKNPDQSRSGSISSTWRYPKDVFEIYDSATVHTVKVRPPVRLFIFLAILILAPALIAWAIFRPRGPKPAEVPPSPVAALSAPTASGGAAVLTKAQYLAAQVPRVEGLAYTAPVYDQLTQPVAAPFPVGCIEGAKSCRCYTEQGTRIDVPESMCLQIVERGFFQFWKQQASHAPGGKDDKLSDRGKPLPESVPIASPPPVQKEAGA